MKMSMTDIVEFTAQQLEKASTAYRDATLKTANNGFKKLLHSITEHEKDNVARLSEWSRTASSAAAGRSLEINLEDHALPIEERILQQDEERLLLFIAQKKRLVRLFEFVSDQCPEEEGGYFFRNLAEDEMKQQSWIQNHYDMTVL